MTIVPEALRLHDLLKVEAVDVTRSIWILDAAELSFEITQYEFLPITLKNLARKIEYRFIFPDGMLARRYWEGLYQAARKAIDDPECVSRLQARFLPGQLLGPVSDFVIYLSLIHI